MKTINEVYAGKTFKEIEASLKAVGRLIEAFQREGKSFTVQARLEILEARLTAQKYGLSIQMISQLEAEGQTGGVYERI